MSKLLKPFLAGLIKTGSIEIETGERIQIHHRRWLRKQAGPAFQRHERSFPAHGRPRTSIRRTLHGRPHRSDQRHALRCVDAECRQSVAAGRFTLVAPGGKGAQCAVPVHAPQRTAAGKAQRRPSLRFRRRFLQKVPGLWATIFLRLFRARGPKSRKRAARQETPYRGETFDRAWPQCARYRLRLWRDGELSGAVLRRECNRRHAITNPAWRRSLWRRRIRPLRGNRFPV